MEWDDGLTQRAGFWKLADTWYPDLLGFMKLSCLDSGKWAFSVNQVQVTLSFLKILLHSVLCFTEFRSGKAPILIATDVASRGLGLYT